jgi:cytosine/adenosine deaminase-related metal-dependent hydrolase
VQYVTGKLLTENGFIPGHLGFEDGVILEVGKGPKKGAIAKGLIIPSMFDAHTHLGDSFLRTRLRKFKGERSVPALFAPPAGFKHRELQRASQKEVAGGIRRSLGEMMRTGSRGFCDFREGGLRGLEPLEAALRAKPLRGLEPLEAARKHSPLKGIVLGRPARLEYDKEEVDGLLARCDGIGVSAVSDWEYPELQKLAAHARGNGKLFGIHASEVVRESIDAVLDLKPSFIVHLVKAEEFDYERVASEGVPVVVCPQANAFFGLRPRPDVMARFGITVALGTDNAMISRPRMLGAVQSAWEITRQSGTTAMDILGWAIDGFRKILNVPESMPFRPGMAADFFVVGNPRMYSAADPLAALVGNGERAMTVLASAGGRVWRKGR